MNRIFHLSVSSLHWCGQTLTKTSLCTSVSSLCVSMGFEHEEILNTMTVLRSSESCTVENYHFTCSSCSSLIKQPRDYVQIICHDFFFTMIKPDGQEAGWILTRPAVKKQTTVNFSFQLQACRRAAVYRWEKKREM